jgi:hypothetical protein
MRVRRGVFGKELQDRMAGMGELSQREFDYLNGIALEFKLIFYKILVITRISNYRFAFTGRG